MDREARWATVHGLQRVGHELETQQQQQGQVQLALKRKS